MVIAGDQIKPILLRSASESYIPIYTVGIGKDGLSRDTPTDPSSEGIFGHIALQQPLDSRGSTHANGN